MADLNRNMFDINTPPEVDLFRVPLFQFMIESGKLLSYGGRTYDLSDHYQAEQYIRVLRASNAPREVLDEALHDIDSYNKRVQKQQQHQQRSDKTKMEEEERKRKAQEALIRQITLEQQLSEKKAEVQQLIDRFFQSQVSSIFGSIKKAVQTFTSATSLMNGQSRWVDRFILQNSLTTPPKFTPSDLPNIDVSVAYDLDEFFAKSQFVAYSYPTRFMAIMHRLILKLAKDLEQYKDSYAYNYERASLLPKFATLDLVEVFVTVWRQEAEALASKLIEFENGPVQMMVDVEKIGRQSMDQWRQEQPLRGQAFALSRNPTADELELFREHPGLWPNMLAQQERTPLPPFLDTSFTQQDTAAFSPTNPITRTSFGMGFGNPNFPVQNTNAVTIGPSSINANLGVAPRSTTRQSVYSLTQQYDASQDIFAQGKVDTNQAMDVDEKDSSDPISPGLLQAIMAVHDNPDPTTLGTTLKRPPTGTTTATPPKKHNGSTREASNSLKPDQFPSNWRGIHFGNILPPIVDQIWEMVDKFSGIVDVKPGRVNSENFVDAEVQFSEYYIERTEAAKSQLQSIDKFIQNYSPPTVDRTYVNPFGERHNLNRTSLSGELRALAAKQTKLLENIDKTKTSIQALVRARAPADIDALIFTLSGVSDNDTLSHCFEELEQNMRIIHDLLEPKPQQRDNTASTSPARDISSTPSPPEVMTTKPTTTVPLANAPLGVQTNVTTTTLANLSTGVQATVTTPTLPFANLGTGSQTNVTATTVPLERLSTGLRANVKTTDVIVSPAQSQQNVPGTQFNVVTETQLNANPATRHGKIPINTGRSEEEKEEAADDDNAGNNEDEVSDPEPLNEIEGDLPAPKIKPAPDLNDNLVIKPLPQNSGELNNYFWLPVWETLVGTLINEAASTRYPTQLFKTKQIKSAFSFAPTCLYNPLGKKKNPQLGILMFGFYTPFQMQKAGSMDPVVEDLWSLSFQKSGNNPEEVVFVSSEIVNGHELIPKKTPVVVLRIDQSELIWAGSNGIQRIGGQDIPPVRKALEDLVGKQRIEIFPNHEFISTNAKAAALDLQTINTLKEDKIIEGLTDEHMEMPQALAPLAALKNYESFTRLTQSFPADKIVEVQFTRLLGIARSSAFSLDNAPTRFFSKGSVSTKQKESSVSKKPRGKDPVVQKQATPKYAFADLDWNLLSLANTPNFTAVDTTIDPTEVGTQFFTPVRVEMNHLPTGSTKRSNQLGILGIGTFVMIDSKTPGIAITLDAVGPLQSRNIPVKTSPVFIKQTEVSETLPATVERGAVWNQGERQWIVFKMKFQAKSPVYRVDRPELEWIDEMLRLGNFTANGTPPLLNRKVAKVPKPEIGAAQNAKATTNATEKATGKIESLEEDLVNRIPKRVSKTYPLDSKSKRKTGKEFYTSPDLVVTDSSEERLMGCVGYGRLVSITYAAADKQPETMVSITKEQEENSTLVFVKHVKVGTKTTALFLSGKNSVEYVGWFLDSSHLLVPLEVVTRIENPALDQVQESLSNPELLSHTYILAAAQGSLNKANYRSEEYYAAAASSFKSLKEKGSKPLKELLSDQSLIEFERDKDVVIRLRPNSTFSKATLDEQDRAAQEGFLFTPELTKNLKIGSEVQNQGLVFEDAEAKVRTLNDVWVKAAESRQAKAMGATGSAVFIPKLDENSLRLVLCKEEDSTPTFRDPNIALAATRTNGNIVLWARKGFVVATSYVLGDYATTMKMFTMLEDEPQVFEDIPLGEDDDLLS